MHFLCLFNLSDLLTLYCLSYLLPIFYPFARYLHSVRDCALAKSDMGGFACRIQCVSSSFQKDLYPFCARPIDSKQSYPIMAMNFVPLPFASSMNQLKRESSLLWILEPTSSRLGVHVIYAVANGSLVKRKKVQA